MVAGPDLNAADGNLPGPDSVMLHALLAVLMISTLAYGTTGTEARVFVQTGVFTLFFVAALKRPWVKAPGVLPLCCLGGLWLLQLLPLPPGLLSFVSPATAAKYAATVWVVSPESWMPLSLHPLATFNEGAMIACGAVVYLLTLQLLADRNMIHRAVSLVTVFAMAFATLSILCHLFPNDRVLWLLHPWPKGQPGFGTFVNPNHFASFVGMLLPLSMAQFLLHRPVVSYSGFRERLVDFFSDAQTGAHLFYSLSTLLLALSIFLSLSRGGILSALAALFLFGLLLVFRGRDLKRGLQLVILTGLIFLTVGMFGWGTIFSEFAKVRDSQGHVNDLRISYWLDSLSLMSDHPVFGTGLGTFVDAYSAYQTVSTGREIVDHAHNDYVELATDGGLLGVVFSGWFLFAVLGQGWRSLKQRRSSFSLHIGFAVMAGLTSVLLHSLVEFNLHIGANLVWFFFLCGVLTAVSKPGGRNGRRRPESAHVESRHAMLWPAGCLLLAGIYFGGGQVLADLSLPDVEEIDLLALTPGQRDSYFPEVEKAGMFAPMDARYPFFKGNLALTAEDSGLAATAIDQAIRKRPLDSRYLLQAARLADYLGNADRAGVLMKSAAVNAPMHPGYQEAYASWLLSAGRREESLTAYRRVLELDPAATRRIFGRLILAGLNDQALEAMLPRRVEPQLAYAEYLQELRQVNKAEAIVVSALQLVGEETDAGPEVYIRAANFYAREKRIKDAYHVVSQGLESYPYDLRLLITSGKYAELLNLPNLAVEAYRKAALLNPRDRFARQRLANLEEASRDRSQ